MLDLKEVTLCFNKGTEYEKKALNHVNLHLNQGDFVTIIGSNGAGKSTLLNAISGLYESEGEIQLDGIQLQHMKEHKRAQYIGKLFQDPLKGTAPDMTIEENLLLAYGRGKKNKTFFEKYLKTKATKEEKEYFKEQLQKLHLELENRMNTQVGVLSGGQRQALTLLMATLNPPKLLLLDEHTAALDPKTAQHVMKLTEDIIKSKQITTLMITHNIAHALKYGNRMIVMSEGRIIMDFSKKEKDKLSVEDVMELYAKESKQQFSDAMLLTA